MILWRDRLQHPSHANIFCKARRSRAKQSTDVPELAAVKIQRPIASDDEHRVLEFRPRTPARTPALRSEPAGQVRQQDNRPEPNDLSRYERDREEPDDFRQRMLANIAAIAFTVALTAIGIWLAMSISDLRRTQDCVLMGRHDCVRISPSHI
jgi:hypothetical protein